MAREKDIECTISFVYGLHTLGDRKVLWDELENKSVSRLWIVLGILIRSLILLRE